jgi:hypothetical protein
MSFPESRVSDSKLGLKPRWFTGQQWADGTAQEELRREFKQAFHDFRRAHGYSGQTGKNFQTALDLDGRNG